jgi:hypothetical protein
MFIIECPKVLEGTYHTQNSEVNLKRRPFRHENEFNDQNLKGPELTELKAMKSGILIKSKRGYKILGNEPNSQPNDYHLFNLLYKCVFSRTGC